LPKLDLGGKSLLVDLGCGDGRWIIRAAKQSGCRCIGCDLDNERLALAQTRVESHGLSDRVEVRKADIFEFARSSVIEQADVVVLYLFREAMLTMSEILRQRRSMRNFTIVSIGFTLPSFVPSWEGESKGIRVFLY
jgi:2-polyprenyl-3-methyl-5-hydroxy-6-metoxy-1,4-benzoquinol methylase